MVSVRKYSAYAIAEYHASDSIEGAVNLCPDVNLPSHRDRRGDSIKSNDIAILAHDTKIIAIDEETASNLTT